ncbi:TetR/AcrR family transcriptional regulator [Aquisalibacillus elongatus]|uniref:TetR family transcriptional regulator n=1 Tax=Aquisalibacillus elongatus TaxID=485577 RepID=A0A3N5B7P2_9BACI|nr:TetR/AcrR family transcriptional regulator [Aquisalibacillus elongatus]RPF53327.1 TetR family transcriptional regulator [Aquisalibacillus elongatus]
MSTKENIKVAATKLFAERDFLGMTMKEIANEVGIKAPSVYAFFNGKEDLFLAIYHDLLDGHLTVVESQSHQHESAKDQLYNILKSAIDFQYKEELKSKFLVRLIISPPDFLKEDIRNRFAEMEKGEYDVLYQIFQQGMETSEIGNFNPDHLAISFQGLMDGLFWEMQRYEVEVMYERMDLMFNQFWRGIEKD